MEEVDDGDNNEVEEIVWNNFSFQFDAKQSSGNIANYSWNFGDGNMFALEAVVTATFSSRGNIPVRLKNYQFHTGLCYILIS